MCCNRLTRYHNRLLHRPGVENYRVSDEASSETLPSGLYDSGKMDSERKGAAVVEESTRAMGGVAAKKSLIRDS